MKVQYMKSTRLKYTKVLYMKSISVKPGKAYLFFSFSENERIGNPCRDGTNKTLDFSLDLR